MQMWKTTAAGGARQATGMRGGLLGEVIEGANKVAQLVRTACVVMLGSTRREY
jgi:hypothetical protein